MKAKKMTQKLTLLTFTALFIAFMFNACSDVAGPNENIGSEISSTETEMQDFRGIINSRRAVGGGGAGDLNCTLNEWDLQEGPSDGRTTLGTVTPSFENGKLVVTIKLDEGYIMSEAKGYVGSNPPSGPGQLNVEGTYNDEMTEAKITFDITGAFSLGDTLYVAVKSQVSNDDGTGDFSATAGDNEFHRNQWNFSISYECPVRPTSGSIF